MSTYNISSVRYLRDYYQNIGNNTRLDDANSIKV